MAYRLQYQPRFHETVTIRTTGRLDGMRVIMTDEGVLRSLVGYFLAVANAGKSPSWQAKAAHAVGLLYDYMVAVPPQHEALESGEYLNGFVLGLSFGSTNASGEDPTGLRWHAGSRSNVLEILRYVTAFTDWCAATFGGNAANPRVAPTFTDRIAELYRREKQNSQSLFAHLRNARAVLDGASHDGESTPFQAPAVRGPRAHKVLQKRPPAFPRAYDARLFLEGFVRRGAVRGAAQQRLLVRDEMMALLHRYGGLRRSEALHLYVGDVLYNPDTEGARVLLFHPEDGQSPPYTHPQTGQPTRSTRTEYLKVQWSRMPRTLAVGVDRVGWKDLMLEEGAPLNYANLYWLSDGPSRRFWDLYNYYIRHVRPRDADHPYLFCSKQGAPWKYERAGAAIASAVRRIGLVPSKPEGTTHHGLRHAYAQDLKRAGIPEAYIQICLHHRQAASQQVYTAPHVADVNRALKGASAALSSAPTFLPSLSATTATPRGVR